MILTKLLSLPDLQCYKNLDDPQTTLFHAKIIKEKALLKFFYLRCYKIFKRNIPRIDNHQKMVEIGSGGGFIKEIIPSAITSDVLKLPNVDRHFSALKMPFNKDSLDVVFAIDVLHHLSDLEKFFKEIDRCLKVGGRLIAIEPANTVWSSFIYKNFHHEDFNPKTGWTFNSTGPLSCANMALPWAVFVRDRKIFKQRFPQLIIKNIEYHTPLIYLLSGGFATKQFVPNYFLPLVNLTEWLISPLNKQLAMFMTITVEKSLRDQENN